YEPLPSDGSQIRLVTIISAKKEEEIECVIAHFPFTKEAVDNLKYEAFSYVWGDATVTAPIKLNGQTFHATKNLEAALRILRLQNEERLIWIDAICINQSSIEERNQEVRHMDQIYQYAVRAVSGL
ncbi:HET-domain-containing protein, partial [Hyaloscypha bicolor E]